MSKTAFQHRMSFEDLFLELQDEELDTCTDPVLVYVPQMDTWLYVKGLSVIHEDSDDQEGTLALLAGEVVERKYPF